MNIPKYKKIIHTLGIIFKTIFWIGFSIGIISAALVAFYFFSVASTAPSVNVDKIKSPVSSGIYNLSGTKLSDIGNERKYEDVKYEELPENLINAVTAIEDRKFFTHDGYDLARVIGSMIKNSARNGNAGTGAGGSTITQQVVKNTQNLRKGKKDIGYEDKIKEVIVANELEQKMSKQEILATYLNTNYYYGRIVGVRAAAKYYFNKEVSQLTLPESALLAGIPQAPSYYNPYSPFQDNTVTPEQKTENDRLPFDRYRMVLSSMVDAGYISKTDYLEAAKLPLSQLLKNGLPASDQTLGAYTSAALNEARQKLNITDDKEPFPAGTKIYINVNDSLQKLGNDIQDTSNYIKYPSNDYDMSYTVIENKTGRILAIGAGRGNNTSLVNFNNATQGLRQPGSTIKPLLDYAPAIEKFKWSSGKLVNDSAANFIGSSAKIVNYDNRYKGVMSITSALADSRNVPAVLTYREVNKDQSANKNYSADFVKKLGITLNTDEMVEPYAIGGFKTGVTTLQMASAYSAFANAGKHASPNFVSKIVDSDNNTVYEWRETADSQQAMSSETASIITSALNYTIVSGGARTYNVSGLELAGKTGTTDDGKGNAKDHWFVGYSNDYTVAVWGGNKNQNKPVYYEYTNYLATVFKTLMKAVGKPNSKFVYSDNTYLKGTNRYWKNYNNDGGVLFTNGNPGDNEQIPVAAEEITATNGSDTPAPAVGTTPQPNDPNITRH